MRGTLPQMITYVARNKGNSLEMGGRNVYMQHGTTANFKVEMKTRFGKLCDCPQIVELSCKET
jgi:trimethylamine:corrinoid methyltransferase-like protein